MSDSTTELAIAQRVQVLSERAEGHREVYEDAIKARDLSIYEAIDEHGIALKKVAGWAKMSTANTTRIVERHARQHAS